MRRFPLKDQLDPADPIKKMSWSELAEQAAWKLADGIPVSQVTRDLKIRSAQMRSWRGNPEFCARVRLNRETIQNKITKHFIGVIENRVAALQERWDKLNQIIKERAASPAMQKVPGGTTGLIVISDIKRIGTGKDANKWPIYEIDTGLLKELREHEKQVAQELGQWEERTSSTVLYKVLVGVSLNDL